MCVCVCERERERQCKSKTLMGVYMCSKKRTRKKQAFRRMNEKQKQRCCVCLRVSIRNQTINDTYIFYCHKSLHKKYLLAYFTPLLYHKLSALDNVRGPLSPSPLGDGPSTVSTPSLEAVCSTQHNTHCTALLDDGASAYWECCHISKCGCQFSVSSIMCVSLPVF